MFVEGKRGDKWEIAEDLEKLAEELVYDNEEVGHVEVDKVVFLRVFNSSAKWLGKCFLVKIPQNVIPKHVVSQLRKAGVIDDSKLSLIPENLFDIRYIIAINQDKLEEVGQGPILDKMERITLLHELTHIGDDMEGLRKHDCEDFKFLIDKYGSHWDEGVIHEDEEDLPEEVKDVLPPSLR